VRRGRDQYSVERSVIEGEACRLHASRVDPLDHRPVVAGDTERNRAHTEGGGVAADVERSHLNGRRGSEDRRHTPRAGQLRELIRAEGSSYGGRLPIDRWRRTDNADVLAQRFEFHRHVDSGGEADIDANGRRVRRPETRMGEHETVDTWR
jgi:hypothetical protein